MDINDAEIVKITIDETQDEVTKRICYFFIDSNFTDEETAHNEFDKLLKETGLSAFKCITTFNECIANLDMSIMDKVYKRIKRDKILNNLFSFIK